MTDRQAEAVVHFLVADGSWRILVLLLLLAIWSRLGYLLEELKRGKLTRQEHLE